MNVNKKMEREVTGYTTTGILIQTSSSVSEGNLEYSYKKITGISINNVSRKLASINEK